MKHVPQQFNRCIVGVSFYVIHAIVTTTLIKSKQHNLATPQTFYTYHDIRARKRNPASWWSNHRPTNIPKWPTRKLWVSKPFPTWQRTPPRPTRKYPWLQGQMENYNSMNVLYVSIKKSQTPWGLQKVTNIQPPDQHQGGMLQLQCLCPVSTDDLLPG